MSPRVAVAVFAGLFAALLGLSAQEPKGPTAEQVRDLQAKFQAEREAAAGQNFTPAELAKADEFAKRAAAALEANNPRAAARLVRDARWQLPYRPAGVPEHVSRVIGLTRMRHGDKVTAVATLPGDRVASASADGTAKIWDAGNGRELLTYRGHLETPPAAGEGPPEVRALAVSPDGKLVASAAGSNVHLWDAATGERKQSFKAHAAAVNGLAFRPDGKAVASCGDDRTVRVSDLDGKPLFTSAAQRGVVHTVSYSADGKFLASGNQEGELTVYFPDGPADRKTPQVTTGVHANGVIAVAFAPDGTGIYSTGDKSPRLTGGPGSEGQPTSTTGTRVRLYEGHPGRAVALAVSKDGKTLATAGRDNSIRVWEAGTGKLLRVFQGHLDEVSSLAFAPDGQTLVSGGADQSVRLWDLNPTDENRPLDGHTGYVWAAAFSPDGTKAASAGADKTVLIWDVAAGKVLKTLTGHAKAVTALAFGPDGLKLASCGGDKLIKLWDVASGAPVRSFEGHTSAVMAVAFTPDGKSLLSGAADKTAKVWEVETGRALHTIEGRSAVSAVAVRKDGKQAALGGADGQLRIIDLAGPAPKEVGAATAHVAGVGAVAYSPDGGRLATCGGDGLVVLWQVTDNAPTRAAAFEGHGKPVSAVAFSPDGRFLASAGGDQQVRVWNLQSKTEVRALRGHTDWVSAVAFGGDGRYLISAGVDKTVRVWELTGDAAAEPAGHTRKLRTVAVSADGKWVASGSDDRTVRVWELATGKELMTLAGHTNPVVALAFSPDRKRLVSAPQLTDQYGYDDKLRFWDLETGKEIKAVAAGYIARMIFLPGGEKLLAWHVRKDGDKSVSTIQVYDADGKPLDGLPERDLQLVCMAWTPDGETVATGADNGTVRVWKRATKERVGGDWQPHAKNVRDVGLTPDGKTLVTGDEEGEIKVWDIATRAAKKTLNAHREGLFNLLVSPDGKRLATVGVTGEVKLWDLESGNELRKWALPTPVEDVAFTPDGKHLLTANGDTTMCVLEMP